MHLVPRQRGHLGLELCILKSYPHHTALFINPPNIPIKPEDWYVSLSAQNLTVLVVRNVLCLLNFLIAKLYPDIRCPPGTVPSWDAAEL